MPAEVAAMTSPPAAPQFEHTTPQPTSSVVVEPVREPAPLPRAEGPAATPPATPSAMPAPADEPPPVAPRAPQQLPLVATTLPPDSGLELVETRFKPAEPVDEPPPAPAPRRVRPPKPVVADEPLQIVETRRETPPAG